MLPWLIAAALPKCPLCLGAWAAALTSCGLGWLLTRSTWFAVGTAALAIVTLRRRSSG